MRGRLAVAVLALVMGTGCTESWAGDPWADVRVPSSGNVTVFGAPSAGCISGAQALPLEGEGYQVLRLERNRYYGHPATIAFVERLAREAHRRNLGEVLVGDMGQPRGGPMPAGHASHQNGLDVDIWLRLDTSPLAAEERAHPLEVSMVKAQGVDHAHWTSAQARLIEIAARDSAIDRILVNPAIKAELCNAASETDRAWLSKLRPWWGHDGHMHIRLACPPGQVSCVQQKPVPSGDGCGGELYSWLSKASIPVPDNLPNFRHPVLPAQCSGVLRQAVHTAGADVGDGHKP